MKNQISFQNPFENVSDGVFLVILEYLQAKPSILEGLQQDALTFSKCSLLDQRLSRLLLFFVKNYFFCKSKTTYSVEFLEKLAALVR